MLNKYMVVFSITISLLSSTVKADSKDVSENSFKTLLECMKTVPIDVKKYKGVGSSQIVLLSVLKNITQSSASIKDLDIDYSEIYKLVESSCPKELNVVKKLSAQKQG
ncbi:MAG: hypothetical protein HRT52_01675 [Colwellia sp.]|nr:hypothetical protein [Colwellia sp.]